MARRRYLSTQISVDTRVNRLAETHGGDAALLYTWMIPHADDAGTITADPEEIQLMVFPGRRSISVEDIERFIEGMLTLELIERDDERGLLRFPESFARHQSYINKARRESAQNAAEQRVTPQNAASSSSSSSFPVKSSFSSNDSVVVDAPEARNNGGHQPSEKAWTYSLGDLTEPARQFMDAYRAAYGKRKPPNLNLAQVKALEDAMLDLGLERLTESAEWAAKQGVEYGGGGVTKTVNAARTLRQREESELPIETPSLNGAACRDLPAEDISEWGVNDSVWINASDWLRGQLSTANYDTHIDPIRARRDGKELVIAVELDSWDEVAGRFKPLVRRALDYNGGEKINMRFVVAQREPVGASP